MHIRLLCSDKRRCSLQRAEKQRFTSRAASHPGNPSSQPSWLQAGAKGKPRTEQRTELRKHLEAEAQKTDR